MRRFISAIVAVVLACAAGCSALLPPESSILGEPRADLTPAERAAFDRGRAAFERRYTPAEGLAGVLGTDSCASCHGAPAIGGEAPAAIVEAALSSGKQVRLPIRLYGIGEWERLDPEQIAASCGTDEALGIHGHAQRLDGGGVGIFGARPVVPGLCEFVGAAAVGELGLANPVETGVQEVVDNVPNPEISTADIKSITAYVAGLAPPPAPSAITHLEGARLFAEAGCAVCHRPDPGPAAPGWHTDLCLHDMGPTFLHVEEAGDSHSAGPTEWRTAPLRGARGYYHHDARARDIDSAIRAHGGEAEISRQRYVQLSYGERDELLAYLQSSERQEEDLK